MSRLPLVTSQTAPKSVLDLFEGVQKKLGMVPNMMRAMGNSPAALEGYLQFSGSLSKGSLTAKQREQIALSISQTNGCDYCLAAHSTIGKMVGLSSDEIRDSRESTAVDSRTNALLQFANKVLEQRGNVTLDDLQQVREFGFSDGDIAEVVSHVALNVLTNYFNLVAGTEIDFPKAPSLQLVAAAQN